jgi:hypothetical protein
MFHPKHVQLFAGNKILYKKCHLFGTFLKIRYPIIGKDLSFEVA